MLVPFAELDRERLHAAIDAVEPRGQTPIGLSLAQLEGDFVGAAGRKEIMVVTDGIETCDPEPTDPNYPAKVVERLIASGISVRTNIVGFEIGDSATRDFLSSIAAAGQGLYFEAAGEEEIESAFAEAFRARYEISDSAGVVVATGKVGDAPIVLPVGSWGVALATDPRHDLGEFEVQAATLSSILLEKEGDSFAATASTRSGDSPSPIQ
jgi:hypothetical protein